MDGSASQSGSLKSGLPSYTVGVSVGKDHSGNSYVHGPIEHLASPMGHFPLQKMCRAFSSCHHYIVSCFFWGPV